MQQNDSFADGYPSLRWWWRGRRRRWWRRRRQWGRRRRRGWARIIPVHAVHAHGIHVIIDRFIGGDLAVGETFVILLHRPLPAAGVSTGMERGCQQNDSLADGYGRHIIELRGFPRGDTRQILHVHAAVSD